MTIKLDQRQSFFHYSCPVNGKAETIQKSRLEKSYHPTFQGIILLPACCLEMLGIWGFRAGFDALDICCILLIDESAAQRLQA